MPEEEKKMVPIDTSGPDATIDIEEVKDEVGCRNRSAKTRNTSRTRNSKTRNRRKETRRKFRRLQ